MVLTGCSVVLLLTLLFPEVLTGASEVTVRLPPDVALPPDTPVVPVDVELTLRPLTVPEVEFRPPPTAIARLLSTMRRGP